MAWTGLIDRYRDRMAIPDEAPAISLHEGNTPLIRVPRLAEAIAPGADLYVKYEGLNPTGSFKDRGMTTAMTVAAFEGAKTVVCASTGNTAASAAAYAARGGLKCVVLIPDGKIAMGKLAGAIAYGAQVVAIHGSFDDGLRLVRELSDSGDIALVNSVNPARLEGQKTASFEVCEQLSAIPDWLALPVGNAGNISAYWMGFTECAGCAECSVACACGHLGRGRKLPRLLGAQAEGAAPIVRGEIVHHPETLATAIRIGNPARWKQAEAAIQQSDGTILAVSDEEIFDVYRLIAKLEGVFCEPSSATGLAGLRRAIAEGRVDVRGQTVVSVLTGHGLKDPDSAVAGANLPPPIPADLRSLREALA